MVLSWGAVAVKHLLFGVNFVVVIMGIILIAVGASVKAYFYDYSEFLDSNYFSTPNLLIAIGSIIFAVAFFGCCGAFKENFCMTVTFCTLLILIFILELAAGIAGYALRNSTADRLRDTLTTSLEKYNVTGGGEVTTMWDLIQREFECCGVDGPTDWMTTVATDRKIPVSCCGPITGIVENLSCTNSTSSIFETGCVEAFGAFVENHAVTIGGLGIAFALIQLVGILFSCFLAKKVREQELYK